MKSAFQSAPVGTIQAFVTKLNAAGFTAERLPRNLEHNAARMTFRARPV